MNPVTTQTYIIVALLIIAIIGWCRSVRLESRNEDKEPEPVPEPEPEPVPEPEPKPVLTVEQELVAVGVSHFLALLGQAVKYKKEFAMDAPANWDKTNRWAALGHDKNAQIADEIVDALKKLGYTTARREPVGVGIVSVPLSKELVDIVNAKNFEDNVKVVNQILGMRKKYGMR